MKLLPLFLCGLLVLASPASAMPGFIVGHDETPIAVPSTKVIIATHNQHHTLTILPGISSTARDVAMLIPVPSSISAQNIREVSASLFDSIDQLSAPRLREETDPNPCTGAGGALSKTGVEVKSYAVTTKHIADNTDYDISILPAADAANLVTWLADKGYKLPPKTDRIIVPYTQRGMAFVLAKAKRSSMDAEYLKPLQISYDAPKLVLPVRLGLINAPAITIEAPKVKEVRVLNAAPDMNDPKTPNPVDIFNDGGQSLTLYVVSAGGRVGSQLLRSIPLANARMDTDMPPYVTRDFPAIYNRILNMRVKSEGNALITEFAGEAALSADVLSAIGVNWLNEKPSGNLPADLAHTIANAPDQNNLIGGMMLPKAAPLNSMMPKHLQREHAAADKPFLTRLYYRYNATGLPQDIGLIENGTRETLNVRFFTHLPATLDDKPACDITPYQQSVTTRDMHDEQNLSRLTGWPQKTLREKFNAAK